MCGDGANDCGALKAAHTGISLSDAESSVASPFTSRQTNISCVPQVIREGRAALVTSFGIFKYMIAYSVIQFVSVMILYSVDSNLTDLQYVYVDLFLITSIAFFFGRTGSYDGPLSKRPPPSSLISLSNILGLLFQFVLIIVLQTVPFATLNSHDWYLPMEQARNVSNVSSSKMAGYENYVIFSVSSFQYVILAFAFSKGSPYRKPFYSNYGLILCALTFTICTTYFTLAPQSVLHGFIELVVPKDSGYRYSMLFYPITHLVLSVLIEVFLVDFLIKKKINTKFRKTDEKSKKPYLKIEQNIKCESSFMNGVHDFDKVWLDSENELKVDDALHNEDSSSEFIEGFSSKDVAKHSIKPKVPNTEPS